ncbi:J domain-containing protein required for chloroplast accumulation response 1 isoform X2 [Benincasa hispida]|uniref:J domain-containing protein required for chloroplast accumulation response 1 isoform X2 n=1 Tax=Benincasa hispida TaxID=102211 RepID=UPI0018FFA5EB|nr:J domain-containing protein required for chloroplast accumulation response 1 isoform X2 [Benincasa hispida]
MENLSQRESILLGYSLQRSFTNPSSSPRASNRNSDDVDFHDVFGGPPRRRSSVHETRYSFSETGDSFALKGGDDEALPGQGGPWSGLNEKPVFGEEGVHGRRFPSNDFYDDIFKGDDSVNSSPRRHERDIFSSIPGSRVLSPARPLPPPAEPFGSSSLPAQLSLPSRMAKGTDLPAFGSSSLRNKDVVLNGSHTNSPRFTLSRFSSSTSSNRFEDLKTDYNLSDRTCVLSSESQEHGSEGASSFKKPDNALSGNSLTKGVEDGLEESNGGGPFQFHFSIYKWASKGVPLMMPLRGNGSRLREKTLLRKSSSSTDRVVKSKNEMHSPTSTIQTIDFPPVFHETTKVDDEKGTGLLPYIDVDQRLSSSAPSENLSRQSSRKDVGRDNNIDHQTEKEKPHSLPEKVPSESSEKKMISTTIEDQKNEAKSLSSFLLYSDSEQSEEGIAKEYRKGETMAKSDMKSSILSDLSSSPKKQDKQTSLRNSKVKKPTPPSSDMESGHNISRKKVGGKISEFVKLFNQEPASRPREVVNLENDNFTMKQESASKAQTEAIVNKIRKDEKPKLNSNTDASIKGDDVSKQSVDDHSSKKTASNRSSFASSKESSPAPNTVHVPDVAKSTVPDVEEPFQDNFSVKELPQDYSNSAETNNGREELQAIETKIRQWSNGKEGNIRSLLSTLQYVLWPKSGWKPVPLVDIIEGNAVKRSYQKALLYLHPDKLQQKGASSDQKYIAAKVFEILQEAWTHFNTLGEL